MNRRDFLRLLGVGSTVTAAGLLVPEAPRRIYSFLTDNPLAAEAVTVSKVTVDVEQWGAYCTINPALLDESQRWFNDTMKRSVEAQYRAMERLTSEIVLMPDRPLTFLRYARHEQKAR